MTFTLNALTLAIVALHATTATAAPKPEEHLVESYLAIQSALAADSIDGVRSAAGHVAHGAGRLKAKAPAAFERVSKASKVLASAKDLAAARLAFKELSAATIDLNDRGLLGKRDLVAVHCSMAGASWLQTGTAVRNPYYGKSMLACGEVRKVAAAR